jgi:hypothetical protein
LTAARGVRKRPAPLPGNRLLVPDVNGVLTNGRLHYGPGGMRLPEGSGASREECDWLLAGRRRSARI